MCWGWAEFSVFCCFFLIELLLLVNLFFSLKDNREYLVWDFGVLFYFKFWDKMRINYRRTDM